MEEHETLTPLHPDYIKAARISWALFLVPLLAAAIVMEAVRIAPMGVFLIPTLLLGLFLIIRLPARSYQLRGYDMGEDRLRVVRGYMFHTDTIVPFGRIQHIDVGQGPIERIYDLATLHLHTAGNHGSTVDLTGLNHSDALAMRDTIRTHIGREYQ